MPNNDKTQPNWKEWINSGGAASGKAFHQEKETIHLYSDSISKRLKAIEESETFFIIAVKSGFCIVTVLIIAGIIVNLLSYPLNENQIKRLSKLLAGDIMVWGAFYAIIKIYAFIQKRKAKR